MSAESVYHRYYLHQSGHGSDYGGRFGSTYISPLVLQRGYGIGGIFSTVARYLTPVLGALGETAFTAGKNILRDIGHKSIGDILKEQGKIATSSLADRAVKQVHEWIGAGRRRKSIKRQASQSGRSSSSMAKRARTSAPSTTRKKKRQPVRRRKTTGAGRKRRRRQQKRKSAPRRKRTLDIFT